MPDYVADVHVTLKPQVNDPPGLVIKDALRNLGFHQVRSVRSGKYLRIEVSEGNHVEAEQRVREMCQKLLANPVIEDFAVEIAAAVPK